jgi:hypothetical protein
MLGLMLVHLERNEFRAADYYAGRIDAFRDGDTAGISLPLRMLVEERRAERRREQGRLAGSFRAEAEARLEQLRSDTFASPMAEDVTHLARSVILDALGDEGRARQELEAVTVDSTTPPPIIQAYYRQADALYRALDEREALVRTCRQLAENPELRPDVQLYYAQAAVRAMLRGRPYDEADARLARERASATTNEVEFGFAVDLARDVLAIRDSHPPAAVEEALLALYAAQSRPGRRRALIVDAVQRADDVDADGALYALVERDVRAVPRHTRERQETEHIFKRFILSRAYERAAAQHLVDAEHDFDAVVEETGSYEATIGAIDVRIKLRESPETILARYAAPGVPLARARFAKAYLLSRALPKLEGEAHAKAAKEALEALRASWSELVDVRFAQPSSTRNT